MIIKVCGVKYRVKYQKMDDCGRLDRETNEIIISKTVSKDCQAVTFMHEVLHIMNGEISETVVDSLAMFLTQFFRENSANKINKLLRQ